jgi:cell division protein FtsN
MDPGAVIETTATDVEVDAAWEDVPETDNQVVMGRRQVAAVSFVMLAMLALVATVSYAAGKMATPQKASAAVVRQPIPPPTAKVEQKVIQAPEPKPEAAVSLKPAPPIVPTRGQVFLQVAAVDPGMAAVCAEYLKRRGFSVSQAESGILGTLRVLAGPYAAEPGMMSDKKRLEDAGFKPFVRRY